MSKGIHAFTRQAKTHDFVKVKKKIILIEEVTIPFRSPHVAHNFSLNFKF